MAGFALPGDGAQVLEGKVLGVPAVSVEVAHGDGMEDGVVRRSKGDPVNSGVGEVMAEVDGGGVHEVVANSMTTGLGGLELHV